MQIEFYFYFFGFRNLHNTQHLHQAWVESYLLWVRVMAMSLNSMGRTKFDGCAHSCVIEGNNNEVITAE